MEDYYVRRKYVRGKFIWRKFAERKLTERKLVERRGECAYDAGNGTGAPARRSGAGTADRAAAAAGQIGQQSGRQTGPQPEYRSGHCPKIFGYRQPQTGRDACGFSVLWFLLYFVQHFIYRLSLPGLSWNIGSGAVGGDDGLSASCFQKTGDREKEKRMAVFCRMGAAFRRQLSYGKRDFGLF